MTIFKNQFLIGIAAISLLSLSACGERSSTPADGAAAPAATETVQQDPSAAFLAMADRHAAEILALYPEGATELGVSEDVAGEGYLARLANYGFEGQEEMRSLNEEFLQELRAFDRADLNDSAKIHYDVLRNAYETAARRNQFLFGGATPAGGSVPQVGSNWAITPYLVTQLSGPHLSLPRMLQTQQPLETRAHVEAYLSRLEEFGRAFDGIIQTIGADANVGVTPPSFVIEGVLTSIDALTAEEPGNNPLVTVYAEKIKSIDGLSDDDRAGYVARATELVEAVVYPAYSRLAAALENIAPQAGPDAGVWRLGPEGEAFYQMALDSYGAGGMTGEEVHQLGLSEVRRITAEMDALLRSIGLTEGSVSDRMQALSEAPDNLYPNTDEGREALLNALRQQVRVVNEMAPAYFKTLPPQSIEVRRIPVHEQDGAPGGYYDGPSLDGSRPGIYWINLKDTADNPKHSLPSLTYHESVPGHHFQTSLQRDIKDMPLIRNMLSYSEFSEGWALYAEALAKEMGLYDNDPAGDLGRLQAEIFRAARLVVDTGIHYKRWTREQAIDFMVEATGDTRASVTREIERYAAIPGQATSYKLGMLKIQSLRAKAEEELGDQFDIREFHDQVLLMGDVPMPVLERKIDHWIAETRGE